MLSLKYEFCYGENLILHYGKQNEKPTHATNKHVTFNKEEYIGHLEPTITDDTTIDDSEPHSANSITLQKMMAEQVQPNFLTPLIIS